MYIYMYVVTKFHSTDMLVPDKTVLMKTLVNDQYGSKQMRTTYIHRVSF